MIMETKETSRTKTPAGNKRQLQAGAKFGLEVWFRLVTLVLGTRKFR